MDLNLRKFANELSIDSPAPGGGSTAALCGALSASLSSMVSNLTVGKKDYENVWSSLTDTAVQAQKLKDDLLHAVDLDTQAFNEVMSAMKMTKKTEEQIKLRNAAIENSSKKATQVPLNVLENCVQALELAKTVALTGNKNSISDAGVAGLTAQAGAKGAYYNVLINLPGIKDKKFCSETKSLADSLIKKADKIGTSIAKIIEDSLR